MIEVIDGIEFVVYMEGGKWFRYHREFFDNGFGVSVIYHTDIMGMNVECSGSPLQKFEIALLVGDEEGSELFHYDEWGKEFLGYQTAEQVNEWKEKIRKLKTSEKCNGAE